MKAFLVTLYLPLFSLKQPLAFQVADTNLLPSPSSLRGALAKSLAYIYPNYFNGGDFQTLIENWLKKVEEIVPYVTSKPESYIIKGTVILNRLRTLEQRQTRLEELRSNIKKKKGKWSKLDEELREKVLRICEDIQREMMQGATKDELYTLLTSQKYLPNEIIDDIKSRIEADFKIRKDAMRRGITFLHKLKACYVINEKKAIETLGDGALDIIKQALWIMDRVGDTESLIFVSNVSSPIDPKQIGYVGDVNTITNIDFAGALDNPITDNMDFCFTYEITRKDKKLKPRFSRIHFLPLSVKKVEKFVVYAPHSYKVRVRIGKIYQIDNLKVVIGDLHEC